MSNEPDMPTAEVPEPVTASQPAPETFNATPIPNSPSDATPPTPSVPVGSVGTSTKKGTKSKWFLPAIVGGVLVLGGGAYAYFGVYTQSATYIWKQSLKNTSRGLKDYAATPTTQKKGAKVTGSFKLSSPVGADGTMQASTDGKNSVMTLDAGLSGVRVNLELRAITNASAKNPDLYLKVDGLKSFVGLLGANAAQLGPVVDSVNGKWFSADHTLFDQAVSGVSGGLTTTSLSAEAIQNDLNDLAQKVANVLGDKLFTDDSNKAVVVIKDKLGKEDFKGRKTEHLRVQVRKQQLHDLVVALKDAVKDSKAKELLTSSDKTKTFEQEINFDSLLKQIDAANYDKAVAEVWLDTGLKYVRNVRIPVMDSKDSTKVAGSVDFMLDYKGGDEIPLKITLTSKSNVSEGTVNLGITLNKKAETVKLDLAINETMDKQKIQATGQMTITGSDDTIKVDKPAGATNIMELIGSFFGGTQSTQKELLNSAGAGVRNPLQLQSIIDDIQAQ